ncbi:hypothetical protein T4D_9241 [Trichinella pseudospiralis]|uniref:Uncharacterized protein n=1 Tax=Trichinella pseudospiralis TaxID=6337 RepID=A0A0V1DKR4_TRIPS|nr:hypothetical protein T4D_9241 [Trichinella pseudospiralis]
MKKNMEWFFGNFQEEMATGGTKTALVFERKRKETRDSMRISS